MRKEAQKGIPTNMTNAGANTAAAGAEQGAHVAPEKPPGRNVPVGSRMRPRVADFLARAGLAVFLPALAWPSLAVFRP
jgi:hypothetical protein